MLNQRARKKKAVLVISLALTLALVYGNGAATAATSPAHLNIMPAIISGVQPENCAYGKAELPPDDVVVSEIKYLEKKLPVLAGMTIPVYTVEKRCNLPGLGMLAGCTLPGEKSIYLFASSRYTSKTVRVEKGVSRVERFAPYLASYTIAHEYGHILRFQSVSDQQLQEYIKFRGIKTDGSGWATNPEEVFAEDFRWLFGSEKARYIQYMCRNKPPGEREREYILDLLTEA
ncbi:MAG: hypothetical protein AB1500_09485 [Bacillota bacterium]